MDEENKQQPETDTGMPVQSKEEEYLNNWKRERADFINYKKDEQRRMSDFLKFANEGLILEIIEVLDTLDIGLKYEPNETLKKLSKDFNELLKKYGLERILVEKFNPMFHEAVGMPEGDKIEEVRAGYWYPVEGKVIRSARVQIIK